MRFQPLLALVFLVLAAGCGSPAAAEAQASGFADDRSVIQVVSTNVGGKNVYIPSTIVVVAGKGRTLSLYNTTEVPHGFEIRGIGLQEILPPQTEHEVELPELEGGRVHSIRCQLHPAHRTGTLVVLPGR